MSLLIPEGDTLVTYYMLPLVGLNKVSFGKSFKTSYIDKDGLKIYVELKSNMQSPTYKQNPNYITELVHKNTLLVLFVIPSRFIEAGKCFVKGLYSQIPADAKKIIFATSTLPYNKTMGSFAMSSPILQALDKTKTLRSFLIDTLGVLKIADSEELIDLPQKHWFIENKIKNEQKVSN